MANRSELAIIRDARAGQVAAQLALGECYLFGSQSLPQSMTTALYWLDRAARQECQAAWMLIGSHIPFEIVQQSAEPLALCAWYEKAFDAGVVHAGLVFAKLVLTLGIVRSEHANYDNMRSKAREALLAAARAGLVDAQWLLAQQVIDIAPAVSVSAASEPSMLEWTARAADGGVVQAQHVLAEHAWASGDHGGFLRWALPIMKQGMGAMSMDDVCHLASRCAQALSQAIDFDPEEVQRLWMVAARGNDKHVQLSLGLWFAKMDMDGARMLANAGSANFKKAIRYLSLADEQGLAQASYVLSKIYIKPQFSQRNLSLAQRYLERAAEMGHCTAQFECGVNVWRNRRDDETNDVRAVYWLQKAAAQGNGDATTLLGEIAQRAVPAVWALTVFKQLTRDVISSHPFLAARIELAALFGLSRPEALLLNLRMADQGHCLLVDIRANFGRSKRRLILLQTGQERQALDRIMRLFENVDDGMNGPEGNYRQRLYRLKKLLSRVDQNQMSISPSNTLTAGPVINTA